MNEVWLIAGSSRGLGRRLAEAVLPGSWGSKGAVNKSGSSLFRVGSGRVKSVPRRSSSLRETEKQRGLLFKKIRV